jgi:hypothetical protein
VIQLKVLSALCFAFVAVGTLIFYANPALGAPLVQVSPTCGPAEPGFNIVINANGFSPKSNVNWKLIDSHNGIPLYGYFQTQNSTGGFNEVTYMDDLKPGKYTLIFFNDQNNDGKPDAGAVPAFANVTLPCP